MLDFLKKPEEIEEKYWALLIEPEWVTSAIWQIKDGKVQLIHSSPATRWESDENLLEAIDTSLSSCAQNLSAEASDPTKTVFGVPSTWLEQGNIKDEYLEKLRLVCKDLSLVPSGFVVLSEAISHYIKQEEESPLSGIILGISDENLDLSIFSLGKLVGTTNVARSIAIEDDITEGLSRLTDLTENFPSRIILFNQKEQELEEIRNNLNSVDWEKIGGSKFIHTPKVEIFNPSKKIIAVSLAGGSELGAVTGIVETQQEDLKEEDVVNINKPDDLTAEDLGFVTDQPKSPKLPTLPISKFPRLQLPKLPKIDIRLGTKPFFMGGSLILIMMIVSFILWWVLPKATVTLYVTPKKLEENITIDSNEDLKAEKIETVVNGEKTQTTTGTKVVGDKSKGTVEIRNSTKFSVNLPVGSVLTSSADLKFVTTKSASISGLLIAGTYGKGSVDVEAKSIGSEYNLPKDEVFEVGTYPKEEVAAFSVSDFTGGTSREIQAVSENDRKKIFSNLEDELLIEAKKQLFEKVPDDKILIESSIVSEVMSESYSNKVGDEASNLKLSLELKFTASVIAREKLILISRQKLEGKVPSGFVLRDDQLVYSFAKPDDKGSIDVRVTANLLPNIDPNEIVKKIAGRYPSLAENYLFNVPGFVRAEFRIKPLLPGKLGTLPHLIKNIVIEISSDK